MPPAKKQHSIACSRVFLQIIKRRKTQVRRQRARKILSRLVPPAKKLRVSSKWSCASSYVSPLILIQENRKRKATENGDTMQPPNKRLCRFVTAKERSTTQPCDEDSHPRCFDVGSPQRIKKPMLSLVFVPMLLRLDRSMNWHPFAAVA